MADNTQYQKVKEITDQLEQGIQDLFESEKYMSWLRTMSRFHDYSLNNTLLIAFQRPDATLVAGYTAWQKQFGRQVQKGEKAIKILAPAPYKEKVEMEKLDPITQNPILDGEGKPVKEVQEVTRPAFKVVSVFDVSQTEGRELPSIGVDELSGDVREYEMFFEALKRSCPVPMGFENIEGSAKGYYHQMEQRIAIREGMSQVQTIKTAIHEMAHQRLHAIDPMDEKSEIVNQTRSSKEVEAESVAYTVCQHYGIETSDYSFAYVAGWSYGKETPELKASLNTIRKTANEMITEIDGHMLDVKRERSEQLAKELYDYADEVDPYGSQDSIEYVEEFIHETAQDLLNAGEKAEGILKWLEETPVSTEELEVKGKELREKVSAFTGILIEPEATITFYVAECSEFPNMGEFHSGLTLEEAFRLYDQIPARRMNGIKGIGFELHDGSFYDGQYPLMEADRVDEENINIVQHYKESPLVQQAIKDCNRILSERAFAFAKELYDEGFVYEDYVLSNRVAYELREEGIELMDFTSEQSSIIYDAAEKGLNVKPFAIPEFSVEQMELMRDLIEDGEDVTRFMSNGKKLDLSDMVLTEKQISDIHYFRKVDEIPKESFSEEQWKVIQRGIRERLDVTQIANPNLAVVEMKDILKELRREKREAQAAELEATLGLQEDGKYRYYSTQRPIAPGTYPNGENKPVSIENFDNRKEVGNGQLQAWGYLEYEKPLSQKELNDYELKAISVAVVRAKAPEKQTDKKKSVLADLQKKQAQITGAKVPKNEHIKKNTKEMQI